MPRRTVIKDPAHPDFPHGTITGWSRGCRAGAPCPASPTCNAVRLRALKASRVGIARPKWAPAEPVRNHVRALLAADDTLTLLSIARAAGLSDPRKLGEIMRNGRLRTSVAIAERVTGVTVGDARRQMPRVDTAKVRHIINTLRALGYPYNWQARRTGLDKAYIRALALGRWATLTRDHHQRFMSMATAVRDRVADAQRDGIVPGIIARTQENARRDGWWPPASYDDDGQLIPEAMPDHPWASATTRAWRYVDVLRDAIDGVTAADSAVRCDVSDRTVWRIRKAAGLRFTRPDADHDVRLAPELSALAAAWRHRIEQVDNGSAHPVALALDIGMHPSQVPDGHPGKREWQDEQRAEHAMAA